MAISSRLLPIGLPFAQLAGWWQGLRLPSRLAAGASVLVVAGMAHLGVIMTDHIRESVIQQSAAAAALYMDSFVERHVQELSTNSVLSEENRLALERLLSPASMHRPVIAFRIWKNDTVVFSNERELIGKTFLRTASRERAWQGQMAAEFEQPDGDDDEQVRSLDLPVLEVYAPVRERGNGRIIALVETYEIAVELKNNVRASQAAAWVAIVAIGLTVVLLLCSMATTDTIERNSLLGQIGELLRLRQKMRHANLQVSAMNERSMRGVGDELHEGAGQHVALALLKFEALEQLMAKAGSVITLSTSEQRDDLEAIRAALKATLRHIRNLDRSFLPTDIEGVSAIEIFAKAARCHERRTGTSVEFESRGLPDQLPFALKACLYRFALEALDQTWATVGSQRLRALCDDETMVIEIVGDPGSSANVLPSNVNGLALDSLRDRIEAIGGKFKCASTPSGELSLVAELSVSDMEMAGG
jgi:signal transduction histidine kinase